MTAPSSAQSPSGGAAPIDFRKLFDAEVSYVWKTLRRLGVRPSDVEDVANEVWITVHRRLDSYDQTRPIRPWLFGIAYRVAVGQKRLAYRRHEVLEGEDGQVERVASQTPAADEQLSAQDSHRLVLEALESIAIDRRPIFVLHDMDEVEMKDIAAQLDLPINTAYSRLRLAREEFKSAVIRLKKRRSA